MSETPKILVIGAGPFQIPLIDRAKELDYEVLATSYLKNDPGLRAADKGFHVSILDFDGLKKLCEEESVSGAVTCASDFGSLAVGYLNNMLGLNGITEKQVRSVSNKSRFALLQRELDLPRCWSLPVRKSDSLEKVLEEVPAYPVVLKPFYGSGSRGVLVAKNKKEIRRNHNSIMELSFLEKGYLIQEFLDGIEHGGECLIEDGKIAFLQLTHKFRNKFHVPLGHCVPCRVDIEVERSLREQIEKIVNHLEVRYSAVNIDMIVTPKNIPVLIDMSFRLGGNLLPHLVRYAFSVDPYERIIRHCFPDRMKTEVELSESEKSWGSVIFGCPKPSVFTEQMKSQLIQLFESCPGLVDLVFDINPGTSLKCFDEGRNRFGHAIIETGDLESYRKILDSCQAIIQHGG